VSKAHDFVMRANDTEALDFYRRAGTFTNVESLCPLLQDLPDDMQTLSRVVQGLLIHRAWAPAYHASVSGREWEEGLHGAGAMLRRVVELDSSPLTVPRVATKRLVTCCRHFAVLLCALLRYQKIPARARCGFAAYFEDGRFLDHWVCEYWLTGEGRWALIDGQLDDVQTAILKVGFDVTDLPREQFCTARQAWQRCRSGAADPRAFGIADMWGLWFIRGNLLRDLAALNKVEVLPWDVWGPRIDRDDLITGEEASLLDSVAAVVTARGNGNFQDLRQMYRAEKALRPPPDFLDQLVAKDNTGGTGKNPLAP
jgi:hypothetical protein